MDFLLTFRVLTVMSAEVRRVYVLRAEGRYIKLREQEITNLN